MRLSTLIRRLDRERRNFGTDASSRKKRALRTIAGLSLSGPRSIAEYHERLLFLLAYPDDAELVRLATRELRRVASRVRDLGRSAPPGADDPFHDSGIAHSAVSTSVTIDSARWLASRFPAHVEVEWDGESLGDEMDEVVRLLLPAAERDGLMVSSVSTREWLALAKGRAGGSDLAWLLSLFDRANVDGPLLDRIFDGTGLTLRWRLTDRVASRTFCRFPARRTYFQRDALARPASLRDELARRPPAVRRAPRDEARRLIDAARATLCVRERETDPVTYASPHEVLLARLERGVDVALFGMRPDRRLPLESYFGFVAARNRIPCAYGGGWVFLDRCEIGVNVFDTFRGGESARLFADIVRAYAALFRTRLFTVAPYQIGADNPDGIRSGAYWFYDRFGFRPAEPALARLAARERGRIAADRTYRSPPSVLRRLARSRLSLLVESRRGAPPPCPDAPLLALRVSAYVGRRHRGDRARAEAHAARRVARVLGANDIGTWPAAERAAFESLALLVALIPDLGRWPEADRTALARTLRAKGGRRELTYARGMRRHPRLGAALARLADTPLARIGRPSGRGNASRRSP